PRAASRVVASATSSVRPSAARCRARRTAEGVASRRSLTPRSLLPLQLAPVTTDLVELLPAGWRAAMAPHLDPDVVAGLCAFVDDEYRCQAVYPPRDDLFAAFRLCPPERARVLILGQDPYHGEGQAHGLSFSVRPGVAVPPSLRNVFKELRDDLGVAAPASGDRTGWAEQGVRLLTAVLTVRAAAPGSHAGRGWEYFTDAAIRALDAQDSRVV